MKHFRLTYNDLFYTGNVRATCDLCAGRCAAAVWPWPISLLPAPDITVVPAWMKDDWIGNSADFTYPAHKARHLSDVSTAAGQTRKDTGAMAEKHNGRMGCGVANCSNSKRKCRDSPFRFSEWLAGLGGGPIIPDWQGRGLFFVPPLIFLRYLPKLRTDHRQI